jgi:hypothetical protein
MSFITQAFDDGITGISRREIMDEVFGEIRKCEKEFAELLSCYTAPELRGRMETLQQLEDVDCIREVCSRPGFGEQNKDDQLDQIGKAARHSFEKIFITLFDRGVLDRLLAVSEVTDEAEAEVVRMRRDVAAYESEQRALQQQAAAVAAEPTPIIVDPIDQCVADFHSMGSAQFKAKYLNNVHGREYYDSAIAAGRI